MSASLLGGFACASSPQEESTALAEPDPPPPVEAPAAAEGSEATAEPAWPAGAASPEPSPEPAAAAITGIPICDEYLALYERCEEHLKPEIMAGNRRFYRAEAAALQYHAGNAEAASLPDSCRSMLDALRVDCPEQHRRSPASASGGPTP